MRIAFRVDVSIEMGTGHLKRCLSLAECLAEMGGEVRLFCRDLGVDARDFVAEAGFDTVILQAPTPGWIPGPEDPTHAIWSGIGWEEDSRQFAEAASGFRPDWVVVDHYSYDARWHTAVSDALGCRLLVIDDLGDRPLAADLVVDHNLNDDHKTKYGRSIDRIGRLLVGPRFALLGKDYADAPRYIFQDEVQSVGIFMGGMDQKGLSITMLTAVRSAGFSGPIEIVSSAECPHKMLLEAAVRNDGNAKLALGLSSLAVFFARHDMQIGAGGGAMLERCCIGAPTIAIPWADNQVPGLTALADRGAVMLLPFDEILRATDIVRRFCNSVNQRKAVMEAASTLVDGLGCRRVAVSMASLALRHANSDDAVPCFYWRNDPRTRAHSRETSPLQLDDHLTWWGTTLAQANRSLMIAMAGRFPVGVTRLDFDEDACEISVYTDPDLHGVGLGPRMIEQTVQWVSTRHPEVRRVNAFVKAENTASVRAFRAAGFVGAAPWFHRNIGACA